MEWGETGGKEEKEETEEEEEREATAETEAAAGVEREKWGRGRRGSTIARGSIAFGDR